MSDITWTASEEGSLDVEAFFDYAGFRARDLREPLTKVRNHIQTTMELQFDTEGVHRSGGWEQLRPDYLKWKSAVAPGEPILVLTHEMRDIVLSDNSWRVTRMDAEFRPPSEKAGWHQEGAWRSKGGVLPARPILELNESDYQEFEHIFAQWLDELRTAGVGQRFSVFYDPRRPSVF